MPWFKKQKLPTMDPLVEAPKPGAEIEFDEEEKAAVGRRGQEVAALLKGKYFKRDDANSIEQLMVFGEALEAVAKRRLSQGDCGGAAASCLKWLGVNGGNPSAWLLFAEIHIEYGDLVRGQDLIRKAEDVGRRTGFRQVPGSSQRLRDRIAVKEQGFIGNEEEVSLLEQAVRMNEFGTADLAARVLSEAEETARSRGTWTALEHTGIPQRLRNSLGGPR